MKRFFIFVHRWLGVALCLLFLIWFPSGIGMMYWGFPDVSPADRLERAPALDPAAVRLSPEEALARLGESGSPRYTVRLSSYDGRPAYRLGGQIVYADTGEVQGEVSTFMVRRLASAWTGQPASEATIESVAEPDQWTVAMRIADLRPLWKFSWPNGEQVYVSQRSGDVEQYTTTASRLGAWLGPIPHWFYITPLRSNGPEWSRTVIWSSGIGTIAAILGLVVGVWMYSPSKRYRHAGAPSAIPYHGQKRWHTVLGLIFGVATVTWAFSGMLSMDPFPRDRTIDERPVNRFRLADALAGDFDFTGFAAKHPADALRELAGLEVKALEWTSFDGEPVYLATLAGGGTRIVPVHGQPLEQYDTERIVRLVRGVAGEVPVATRVIDQYDRYYRDRTRRRPLPVILATLEDGESSRFYIDPKTADIVATHSDRNWMTRWAYQGLHSLDFPWLYNYRPLWDIVVITFMLGGTALCVTSLVLAWRVLGRKIRAMVPGSRGRAAAGDLAVAD